MGRTRTEQRRSFTVVLDHVLQDHDAQLIRGVVPPIRVDLSGALCPSCKGSQAVRRSQEARLADLLVEADPKKTHDSPMS